MCLAKRAAGNSQEAGFTLIELLLVIVIVGVIAVPLGNVVISYFLNTSTITARLTESHDEQIAAAYWQQDVASVGVRSTTYDTATKSFNLQQSVNTAFPCSVPAGSQTIVVLAWNQYDSSGNAALISVAYVTDSTGTQLTRLHCKVSTLDSTAVLAHNLNAASAPVLTCAGAGGASCTGSGTNVPTSISVLLSVKVTLGKGQPSSVTLNGQRRQT
jgi:prepilin-type N-terminal cleavage/methylation domain-containing protein